MAFCDLSDTFQKKTHQGFPAVKSLWYESNWQQQHWNIYFSPKAPYPLGNSQPRQSDLRWIAHRYETLEFTCLIRTGATIGATIAPGFYCLLSPCHHCQKSSRLSLYTTLTHPSSHKRSPGDRFASFCLISLRMRHRMSWPVPLSHVAYFIAHTWDPEHTTL